MGTKWKKRIRIGLASIGRRATCRWDESELGVQRAQIPSLCLGALGERKKNSEAGARFPVELEIVPAETPLILVGIRRSVVAAVGDEFGAFGDEVDRRIGSSARRGWQ